MPRGEHNGPPYEEFEYRHTSIAIMLDGMIIERAQFWVPVSIKGDPRQRALVELARVYIEAKR